MHKVWECSPMRVLTQAILDIIVHNDLYFDESNVKHVGVEFHMINKPHNIQNITCYIVSMPLCWIQIFSFVLHPWQGDILQQQYKIDGQHVTKLVQLCWGSKP